MALNFAGRVAALEGIGRLLQPFLILFSGLQSQCVWITSCQGRFRMALAHNMAGHSLPLAGSTPTARFTSRCSRSVAARALVQPSIAVSSPFSKDAEHLSTWAPDSWRQKEALQQPNYPDAAVLDAAIDRIDAMPPLVFAGECRILQTRLAKAATGEAFVLFGTLHTMLRKDA